MTSIEKSINSCHVLWLLFSLWPIIQIIYTNVLILDIDMLIAELFIGIQTLLQKVELCLSSLLFSQWPIQYFIKKNIEKAYVPTYLRIRQQIHDKSNFLKCTLLLIIIQKCKVFIFCTPTFNFPLLYARVKKRRKSTIIKKEKVVQTHEKQVQNLFKIGF